MIFETNLVHVLHVMFATVLSTCSYSVLPLDEEAELEQTEDNDLETLDESDDNTSQVSLFLLENYFN